MADFADDIPRHKYEIRWLDGSTTKCYTQREMVTRINKKHGAKVVALQTITTCLHKKADPTPHFRRYLTAMGVSHIKRLSGEPNNSSDELENNSDSE